jgi:hypothetical protein
LPDYRLKIVLCFVKELLEMQRFSAENRMENVPFCCFPHGAVFYLAEPV